MHDTAGMLFWSLVPSPDRPFLHRVGLKNLDAPISCSWSILQRQEAGFNSFYLWVFSFYKPHHFGVCRNWFQVVLDISIMSHHLYTWTCIVHFRYKEVRVNDVFHLVACCKYKHHQKWIVDQYWECSDNVFPNRWWYSFSRQCTMSCQEEIWDMHSVEDCVLTGGFFFCFF